MKSKFLRFSRNKIVKGYVKVAGNLGLELEEQPITKMSHLYEYIQIHKWDDVNDDI